MRKKRGAYTRGGSGRAETLEKVGELLGVTKEAVRKTEDRALKKLANNSQMKKLLFDYLGIQK